MSDDSVSPTAVRIPSSFIPIKEPMFVHPTPLRNLHKDFMDLNEEMQVYVRIKPSKDDTSILSISGNHIIVQPSKDSISFKNRSNAGTKTLQKFKFNKIYDAKVTQDQLFKDSAINLVQDFLLSKNALVFTYGATSAGKTYTMLGTIRDAGLIPRSLDVIFNSLEDKLLKNPFLKPLALNEVMKLNPQQTEAEEVERSLLMKGFDLDSSDTKDSISTVSSASIKDWNIRARDNTVCNLQYPDDLYVVWVSYCEIYNEQVFDLLEACDKKKKRTPLRVTEDRKGKFYVKGLKEICVRSADDAVRVLLYGKENLHFATTKLNHNSSRSHCVFTVKIIRTDDAEEPTEAAVNMMSFVDLAGMERTTKTQSRGERLKEAGNINTSLLILGRCIDAMRSNQQSAVNKMIIPYRESKLTRILQTFLSGQGRAAMFVNVSPASLLCDETVHVLKFGAVAQEIIIQPDRDASIVDMSISQFAPPLRPSRFQQYVRKSISILSAKGASASVLEPSFLAINEDEDSQERIRELEEELAIMKANWEDNEQRIRDECCAEWSEVFTLKEKSWNQRYNDTKALYEEFCENRVDLVTQLYSNCAKKKRKGSLEEDFEHTALQFKAKDDRIELLEESNERLNSLVDTLRNSLKISEEGKAELQKEMTRLQFEVASAKKPNMNFCGSELDDDEKFAGDGDIVYKLKEQLAIKDEMLNEAVIEYHNKTEEMNKVQQEKDILNKEMIKATAAISDLQAQLERSNLLLSDANERLDVREEELVNLEERLMKANGQFGNMNTELREAKRQIRSLEIRIKEQNNASMVSNMCEDLQKQLLEAETLLEKRKEEIERLTEELGRSQSRTDADSGLQDELEKLNDRLTKTLIQLSTAQKRSESLKEANEDLKTRQESMLDEISHLKRDLELSCSERRHEEGSHVEMVKDNEKMHATIAEMRDAQTKLTQENAKFRKAMSEYEATIQEMATQMEKLRGAQIAHNLLEDELKTLAATLGRVQQEKAQMEKDMAQQKIQLEEMRTTIASLKEKNSQVEIQLKESLQQKAGIEQKIYQEKVDSLESENEKLTKQMLKHMRSVTELSETVNKLTDDLCSKSKKCEKLTKQLDEMQSQNGEISSYQLKLEEKENAIKEKENLTKSILDQLLNKDKQLEKLQKQNERVLNEKNLEIDRLESELKSILSGHVNYKKPMSSIKVEKNLEDEHSHEEELNSGLVTPTPVKARRGRAKKISSPVESVHKNADENNLPEIGSTTTTRTRRTMKSDLLAPPQPPSTTKSSARKPRKKNTSESEEVAHPALSVLSYEEAEPTPTVSSKRRLYNSSKCPEVLLPSTDNDVVEIEFPKRMATRNRK